MKHIQSDKMRTMEAIIYPLLLLAVMWIIFLVDRFFHLDLYRYGVKPQTIEGIKGILFMPFIHGQKDYSHIINNSVPIAVLLGTLIYFYREIALYVILFIWIGGGFLLWYFAGNVNTYHIGMSGVIYGLFGFLILSGFFKKYLPLQAISFFVAFMYGSMIWGILPTEERISWEGHLSGFLIGLLLAFAFRKKGPVAPKYRYEIEQEMGIEPPDFEAEWLIRKKLWEEEQRVKLEEIQQKEAEFKALLLLKEEEENKNLNEKASSNSENQTVIYHYTPKKNDGSNKK